MESKNVISLQDGTVLELTKEELSQAGLFAGREDIVGIAFQRGLKIIRKESFARCVNLKSVSLPLGLKAIEADAFAGCTSLEEVTLPDSLMVIEAGAFADTAVKEMVVPDKVERIKARTFAGCRKLERLAVPNVKAGSFDYSALSGCDIKDFICDDEVRREYEEYLYKTDWRSHMFFREESLASLDSFINDTPLEIPMVWHIYRKGCLCGPYFTTRQAYDGLMEHVDMEDGKEMFVKNLVLCYGLGHSFYSESLWEYNIIGYELKGLEPGMPFYLVQADLHHSASFYHSTLLLGIFGKDSQARTCCRKNRSYHSYPYSQGKPEIVTFDQNAGQYHGEVQIDCYNGYYRFE